MITLTKEQVLMLHGRLIEVTVITMQCWMVIKGLELM